MQCTVYTVLLFFCIFFFFAAAGAVAHTRVRMYPNPTCTHPTRTVIIARIFVPRAVIIAVFLFLFFSGRST